MSNQWFRMYHEFANDPKVQMLSEVNQRRYIMLLCLKCCNGDVTLQDEEVAFQLRISNEDWNATKAILVSKNLIDSVNQPVAWDKRQFASDSSAARVARHRERKKKECNVTVTPPDTDTDTDTEELDKSSSKKSQDKPVKTPRFQKPTIDELRRHIQENQYQVDPDLFFAHYEANGWIVGKSKAPMKCWKSALVTWSKREVKPQGLSQFNQPSKTDALRERNKANLDAFAKRMMEQENAIN